jgi:glycosyltransferase involved in cell wall biosynthesis
MKVDVIIPAYNPNMRMLEQAVVSAKSQTWNGDVQITIVDDNSSKDLSAFVKKHGVNYIRNDENKGPSGARNVGIQNTYGDFVSFLDADDVWAPNKILWSLRAFEQHPEIGMTCGNYRFLVRDRLGRVFYKKPVRIDWRALMRVNYVASGSTTVRRGVLEDVGLFNESYWIAEDYDLWVRISEKYPITYIHKILYHYRVIPGGDSLTQRDDIQAKHIQNIEAIKNASRKRVLDAKAASKAKLKGYD